MQRERGQATVEHVGIVLAVALLAAALAAGLGAPALAGRLGQAVATALSDALTPGRGAASRAPAATASEATRFALALDGTRAPDDRPTLRDVRLQIASRVGPERAGAVLRELARGHVETLLPGLHQQLLLRRRGGPIPTAADLETVASAEPHDVERPTGPLDVHVVSAADAGSWLHEQLDPGFSAGDASDVVQLGADIAATAFGLKTLDSVLTAIDAARTIHAQTHHLYPDDGIPPGRREGDIVACYPVERRHPGTTGAPPAAERQFHGSPVRTFAHYAVVRDSAVLAEHELPLATPPGRTPTCKP